MRVFGHDIRDAIRTDGHGNWISRTIDDHILVNGVQMK